MLLFPLAGKLADCVGLLPVMVASSAALIVSAVPVCAPNLTQTHTHMHRVSQQFQHLDASILALDRE